MEKELCLGFLNTPPLWVKKQFGLAQFDFPLLDITHFTPNTIPPNRRLGHKMEAICRQLLQLSNRYAVLVAGLPIKNRNTTLGEIDFIVRDLHLQTIIHIELTYKFYIIDPEISEPIHQLMGPNKRDMFFTKVEKIKQQQFPLLHSREARDLLTELGIDTDTLVHNACFKAQLFVPYGIDRVHIRPLNKKCIIGYWLRFDDFNSKEFQSYTYYIPFKSQWVVTPHNHVPWQSHWNTLMEVHLRMLKENAPMVWMKKSDGQLEKFFVVWW